MTNENPRRGSSSERNVAAGAVELVDQHKDSIAPPLQFQSRDDIAQNNAPGLEAAMKRDQGFFRRHPFLEEYVREIMPGKFPPSIFLLPPGYQLQGLVRVRRISPNVRIRTVLTAMGVPA